MADDFDVKDYNIYLPPLGEGTYGRVFRATYRGISDRALKIFRPGAVDLSTMSRELEKLSSVAEHHGIVTLHDFDLLSEPPYYAMGLHADQNPDGSWETRTLDRLCGHVDYREAWRLLKEIADAMAYLHRHQIVHCDVKPSNILLTDETPYRTKICDFGQSRGLAMEGFEPVGTPLYAPPEQLRDPRNSANGKGFRWDVYSFGVMAFKLVTGRLPRLQELADAERKSFDPEATLLESSIEGTLADAEGRDRIDGNRLATMTEAVEDIRWPADAPFSAERRELIEARNQAESMIHSTEKSMEEHADKVDPTTIEAIELAIAALKDDLETDNTDKIKSGIQNVTEAAMKLGEAIYKSGQDGGDDGPVAADERTPGEDDILDADFEDIDTNKRS